MQILEPAQHGSEAAAAARRAPRASSWRRGWARLGLALVLLIALLGKYEVCEGGRESCKAFVQAGVKEVTALVCQSEYARTGVPRAGALLANTLRRIGETEKSEQLARELLSGPARGEALYVLGKLAAQDKRFDDAKKHLEDAAELHSLAQDWSWLARDLQALAEVSVSKVDFLAALEILERGIQAARRVGDAYVEGYCHLGAARVLALLGHVAGARAELALAERVFSTDYDLAFVLLDYGTLEQNAGNYHQAAELFERALTRAKRTNLSFMVVALHRSLCESLAASKRLDEAAEHLRVLRALDVKKRWVADSLTQEGIIAFYGGHLDQAAALLEHAISTIPDMRDWSDSERMSSHATVALLRAKVALQAGQSTEAAKWANESVRMVEQMRSKQVTLQFRSWLTARYRESYELWFLALARAGRAAEALIALERWQGQAVLEALTPEGSMGASGLRQATAEARALLRFQAGVRQHMEAAERAQAEGLKQLTSIDLLALVVANGELWQLSSQQGAVQVHKVGMFEELSPRLLAPFRAHPTDAALAGSLGALLIPGELARSSRQPLHLLLDAPLAGLPFEALRVGEQPLVALRPVLRVTRPSETACTPPLVGALHAVVIADAGADLPASQREAASVAARFGVTSHTGDEATSSALRTATSADLLHLAVHSGIDDLGGALLLRDGKLSALDIASGGGAPARVVLATCASAVAQEGNYSLAMAFLAAGAQQVVATLRPVSDVGAAEVTERFYREGGATDPIGALAAAQAALASSENRDWPYFSVLGREICSNSR